MNNSNTYNKWLFASLLLSGLCALSLFVRLAASPVVTGDAHVDGDVSGFDPVQTQTQEELDAQAKRDEEAKKLASGDDEGVTSGVPDGGAPLVGGGIVDGIPAGIGQESGSTMFGDWAKSFTDVFDKGSNWLGQWTNSFWQASETPASRTAKLGESIKNLPTGLSLRDMSSAIVSSLGVVSDAYHNAPGLTGGRGTAGWSAENFYLGDASTRDQNLKILLDGVLAKVQESGLSGENLLKDGNVQKVLDSLKKDMSADSKKYVTDFEAALKNTSVASDAAPVVASLVEPKSDASGVVVAFGEKETVDMGKVALSESTNAIGAVDNTLEQAKTAERIALVEKKEREAVQKARQVAGDAYEKELRESREKRAMAEKARQAAKEAMQKKLADNKKPELPVEKITRKELEEKKAEQEKKRQNDLKESAEKIKKDFDVEKERLANEWEKTRAETEAKLSSEDKAKEPYDALKAQLDAASKRGLDDFMRVLKEDKSEITNESIKSAIGSLKAIETSETARIGKLREMVTNLRSNEKLSAKNKEKIVVSIAEEYVKSLRRIDVEKQFLPQEPLSAREILVREEFEALIDPSGSHTFYQIKRWFGKYMPKFLSTITAEDETRFKNAMKFGKIENLDRVAIQGTLSNFNVFLSELEGQVTSFTTSLVASK